MGVAFIVRGADTPTLWREPSPIGRVKPSMARHHDEAEAPRNEERQTRCVERIGR
jgi:hypothetical protein